MRAGRLGLKPKFFDRTPQSPEFGRGEGDDGQTQLELDGYFPSKHGAMTSMMRRGQLIDKDIQGLLKTSNKRVLLTGLTGSGGKFSTNGMSYERYIAGQCLVADGICEAAHHARF